MTNPKNAIYQNKITLINHVNIYVKLINIVYKYVPETVHN